MQVSIYNKTTAKTNLMTFYLGQPGPSSTKKHSFTHSRCLWVLHNITLYIFYGPF